MSLHYKGILGEFNFDPQMFALQDGYLHYIGGTTKGCIKCKIPDGILICDFMFVNNKQLKVGPILPESCISANSMFEGCSNLVVFPEINSALMESEDFDSHTTFRGCLRLEKLCISILDNKSIDPYVCACEMSLAYPAHFAKMQKLIEAENKRKVEDWKLTHWLQQKLHAKTDEEIQQQVPQFNPPEYHTIEFLKHYDLVNILRERQKGNFIGISSTRKSRTSNKQLNASDTPEATIPEVFDDSIQNPEKMEIE